MDKYKELIKKSLSINLYLTDEQKNVLNSLCLDNSRALDNFFTKASILKLPKLDDALFYKLAGIAFTARDMREALLKNDHATYLSRYNPAQLKVLVKSLKRDCLYLEKYWYLKSELEADALPSIGITDFELSVLLEDYKTFDRSALNRLNLYLLKTQVIEDKEEYSNLYKFLRLV